MSIEAISSISSSIPSISSDMTKSAFTQPTEGAGGFGNVLSNAMNSVNGTMNTAKELGEKVATGEVGSLHQLSVAGMKSEIMLKLTTQIAAKLSSAATTLFQMQM